MKASLKNYRHAPRKVRLIANTIRGKSVADALVSLTFMPQKASVSLKKLVLSAFANAKQVDPGVSESALKIKTITVDKGITFVRFMPRAMGRATPINHECSHVRIELGPVDGVQKVSVPEAVITKAKAPAKTAKKTVKK
jgi:large subunit ribosomal protein L22